MAFRNPPIAGSYLVRPAIQSPNYVLGSAGWTVNRDGSAEFNGGTFRGSIAVGSPTGQHFIVNNTGTGDVLDVYNSAGKLVFSIDSTGRLVAASSLSTSTAEIVLNGANLLFEDTAQTPVTQHLINGTVGPDNTFLNFFCGKPKNYSGSGQGAFISLSNGDTPASEWIEAEQRGIQGALVQTDSSTNANQLVHAEMISCATNVNGDGASNHHCGFTPKVINATAAPTSFTQQGVTIMIWQDLTSSTVVTFRILTSTGNPYTGTMNVMFTFWG